ncbi:MULTISPECIES: hypothetical protein [Halococcus]|uniref:FG-GAP repeat-containing protein n=1 Tax=Halococcus salifodinae DSM 8989 TaxID=1227456 RepID=M0N3W6_9EURY|nr:MULTISPECIES: hypothetical protein [Halococcus]EMA52622.1 hypothetical protein C450_11003 [Halococcus salifodinae DSM 8989]
MDHTRRRALAAIATGSVLAGCGSQSESTATTDRMTSNATQRRRTRTARPLETAGDRAFGYTYVRPSGNRFVAGRGALPDTEPVEIGLGETPQWLVALPLATGSLWAVVGERGQAEAFVVRDGNATPTPITPERLPPETPPLLTVIEGNARLVTGPQNASNLSQPLVLDDGRRLSVLQNGDVVLTGKSGTERARVTIDALPDARPVRAGGRVAVLAGRTTRYDHGVLGDGIEAERCVLLDPDDLAITERIEPAGVVEGTAPILASLTGDDDSEVIVTVGDAERGARVVAFDTDGSRLAAGQAFDSGYHWRHQLAVAPFAVDGVPELAAVETPHVGGTVRFYRREGEALRVVGSVSGYASHTIGSRVLDGAVAGDFDSDGRPELLVPDDSRTHLGAVRRTEDGAREEWELPIGGTLTTNVTGTRIADGGVAVGVAVGVGHADGVRIWQSPA